MNFCKMHGLGNDFIIIENLNYNKELLPSPFAIQYCDRHFGVGADGIILVELSMMADIKMRIFNADGSEAEMCGNGVRCFAKYVYESQIVNKEELEIETKAGIIKVKLKVAGDKVVEVSVDMGVPILKKDEIPVLIENTDEEEIIEKAISIETQKIIVTTVSMGNPHCIIFVEDLENSPVSSLGTKIENANIFPKKTNVEFVKIVNDKKIEVRVWERGVGETMACGTGACSAVVASVLTERTGRLVDVELPGGHLFIDWDRKSNHIYMTGPAEKVYTGSIH